jgi:nucleoside-diphosphate-sugar epimerase
MKILLLGAGGFIGANLTERLVNDGQGFFNASHAVCRG